MTNPSIQQSTLTDEDWLFFRLLSPVNDETLERFQERVSIKVADGIPLEMARQQTFEGI